MEEQQTVNMIVEETQPLPSKEEADVEVTSQQMEETSLEGGAERESSSSVVEPSVVEAEDDEKARHATEAPKEEEEFDGANFFPDVEEHNAKFPVMSAKRALYTRVQKRLNESVCQGEEFGMWLGTEAEEHCQSLKRDMEAKRFKVDYNPVSRHAKFGTKLS